MHKTVKRPARTSFVVGPEKTATTFIQLLLEQHPEARLPQGIKETFFFDRFFANGVDWYLNRFNLSGGNAHLIEVAPSYFSNETAIARIAETFPDATIVICVRDVVERTISHYHHMRRYGYLNAPLAECLDPAEPPLRASLYSHYLPLWEKAFGTANVHVLDMALLKSDPAAFAKKTFTAVGLDPVAVGKEVLSTRANEGTAPRNFIVARTATLVSNGLKRFGLYGLLALLRRTPLYTLTLGAKPRRAEPETDAATRARLEALLAPERRFLAERYGIGAPGRAPDPAAPVTKAEPALP